MPKRVIYLVEAFPYDPVGATTRNVFFSDSLADEAALGTSDPYPPRLKEALSHETSVFDQNIPGGTSVSVGSIVINNQDGQFDYLLDYHWDSREIRVKKGFHKDAYATYTTEFVGTVLEILATGTDLTLVIRDNSYKLALPIQTNTYAGTGGAEGNADLVGRLKPLCFGLCRNLTPIVVDPVLLTLQVHESSVVDVLAVYDRGNLLTKGSDFASYAALASATVQPGSFATCLAEGFFRLGAKSEGSLTADVQGHYYATATNIPTLARMVIKDRLGFTDADFDMTAITGLVAAVPYLYEGVYLPDPDTQVDEFLETLMTSINGFWYMNSAGKLVMKQFNFDAPSFNIREEDVVALTKNSSPQPIYKVRVNYSKNPTIQPLGDFVIPRQTLNGYLTDNKVFIPTNTDGTGGNYVYQGELQVFLNDVKVNDLATVTFEEVNPVSWLTIHPDGTFTLTDPGTGQTEYSVQLQARLGEYSVNEVFTLHQSREIAPKNLPLSASTRRFYLTDAGIVSPGGQTISVTATPVNVTTPLVFTAFDNIGNNVPLTGSGNSRTVSASDLVNSPLVFWVIVAVSSPDGTTNSIKIVVQRGEDAYSAGVLGALSATDDVVDIYYLTEEPSGGKTGDLWFDTDDNNKIYRYNGTAWVEVHDPRIAQALSDASDAQATADTKIRTFFSEDTPVAEETGDLWYRPSTSMLRRWDGISWNSTVGTRGAPAGPQTIHDDTFELQYWYLPPASVRIISSDFRSGYGVNMPFLANSDIWLTSTEATELLTRVDAGKEIFARAKLVPEGGGNLEIIEYDGEIVVYGDDEVSHTYPEGEASFHLNVAIEWLLADGTFDSRTVIAVVDPTLGVQTVRGSAIAPITGLARIAVGYSSALGETGGWRIGEPWLAEYQPEADNTASRQVVIVPPTPQEIKADYTGTVLSGQLPRTLTMKVTKGGTDYRVSSSVSYSIANVGVTATINNTAGSADKGKITVTAISVKDAYSDVTVTVDGVAYPAVRIPFTRTDTQQSTTSSGGTGGSFSASGGISSTTFMQIGSTITVTKGTGQTIYGYAPVGYNYYEFGSTGSVSLVAKWQFSPAGAGTWTDMDTAVTGSASNYTAEGYSEAGAVTCNQTEAPANGSYDIRLMGAMSVTESGSLFLDGSTCTVTVS